jgi:hypothetical protein
VLQLVGHDVFQGEAGGVQGGFGQVMALQNLVNGGGEGGGMATKDEQAITEDLKVGDGSVAAGNSIS